MDCISVHPHVVISHRLYIYRGAYPLSLLPRLMDLYRIYLIRLVSICFAIIYIMLLTTSNGPILATSHGPMSGLYIDVVCRSYPASSSSHSHVSGKCWRRRGGAWPGAEPPPPSNSFSGTPLMLSAWAMMPSSRFL